jgi:hypothetical protein
LKLNSFSLSNSSLLLYLLYFYLSITKILSKIKQI